MRRLVRGVGCGFGSAAFLLGASFFIPSTSSAQALKVPSPAPEMATVRAGKVDIVMPAPAAELKEMGPDLRVLMDGLVPANLRLVAAFVPQDQLAQLPGKPLSSPLPEYALLETPRATEFVDLDEATYKSVVEAVGKRFSSGELQSTFQNAVDHRLAELRIDTSNVAVDKPTPLGTIFSKPNATGFAVLTPMNVDGKSVTMAAGTIVVRAHNRLLFAYLFTRYEDKASIDWLTKTSESWADAILKANSQ